MDNPFKFIGIIHHYAWSVSILDSDWLKGLKHRHCSIFTHIQYLAHTEKKQNKKTSLKLSFSQPRTLDIPFDIMLSGKVGIVPMAELVHPGIGQKSKFGFNSSDLSDFNNHLRQIPKVSEHLK